MNKFFTALKYTLLAALLGGSVVLLYTQAKPLLHPACSDPIVYSLGTIDPRFGVSKEALRTDVVAAASVWNTALGTELFKEGEGGVVINLIYSEHQETAELGQAISAEQQAYNAKKTEVEAMKKTFNTAKASAELLQSSYNESAQAYQKEVEMWNAKGGAPAKEYARLQAEKIALDSERTKVTAAIEKVNTLANELNDKVGELNTLAAKINVKTDTYNSTAGTDFEQGEYKQEKGKETIDVFEFTTTNTLKRVLTHELGHALGLEHVENPASIMYAYNVGDSLSLSEEDLAELKKVCNIK